MPRGRPSTEGRKTSGAVTRVILTDTQYAKFCPSASFCIHFLSLLGRSSRAANRLPSCPLCSCPLPVPDNLLGEPRSLPVSRPLTNPCPCSLPVFILFYIHFIQTQLFQARIPPSAMQNKSTQVVFSSDVKNMDEWARRTQIPLTTAEALGASYSRAHRWLQALRLQLIRDHNWSDAPASDSRLLFSLETTSIWRSSVGLPAGPRLKLQLPANASSFFSPERRIQWQMVFHSDIFESVRKLCPPVNDILSLLQCLLTGVVTVVLEENLPQGVYRTTRGLPPVSWINANESALIEIFGPSHFRALRKACNDTKAAFKLEVLPLPE